MITLILVDDHQLVRDGLKSLLQDEKDIQIIGEASGDQELAALLKIRQPDILLLDISMPGKSGVEICREIQQAQPEIRVIMLSMYTDEEFILQALQAGAWAYLPKNIGREELTTAIRKVYQGDEYISDSLTINWTKNLFQKARDSAANPSDVLSRREIEILKLCAEGKTNKEISDLLFISIRTVESHKSHIMQKLELRTSADLIKFAIRNNLVVI